MTSIAHKTMNGIMYVLYVVVCAAAAVRVCSVGEWSIIRYRSNELIGQCFEPNQTLE